MSLPHMKRYQMSLAILSHMTLVYDRIWAVSNCAIRIADRVTLNGWEGTSAD